MRTSARPCETSRGGQGFEPVEVRRYEAGLQEGADEVLALGEVKSYFAPNGPVHHRQQGGRQLDEIYAPHVAAGHETSQVTDHTAPEREERPVAGQAGGGQPTDDPLVDREALRSLARGDRDDVGDNPPRAFEGVGYGGGMERAHVRVGEEDGGPGR